MTAAAVDLGIEGRAEVDCGTYRYTGLVQRPATYQSKTKEQR